MDLNHDISSSIQRREECLENGVPRQVARGKKASEWERGDTGKDNTRGCYVTEPKGGNYFKKEICCVKSEEDEDRKVTTECGKMEIILNADKRWATWKKACASGDNQITMLFYHKWIMVSIPHLRSSSFYIHFTFVKLLIATDVTNITGYAII